jgi:hypothetical protein
MAVSIIRKASSTDIAGAILPHSLHELRRVRPHEFAQLLGTGRSSFYTALKSGRLPKPDGSDGRPFWFQKTVHNALLSTDRGVAQ